VPLLLLLVGGLLAAADPTCVGERKTDEELLQIATHELVHELRTAAAEVFTNRLWVRSAEGEQIPLDFLEDLARSPSPELRGRIPSLLYRAYERALSRNELTIDGLLQGIYTGETYELRLVRAHITMRTLFVTEALGLSPSAPFESWLASYERLLRNGLWPELLRKLMNLMRGEEEELWGYRFDGSLDVIRSAALATAFIFSLTPESGFPSAELAQFCPCEEWRSLAGRSETPELRYFAAVVYVWHCAPRDPKAMHELAANGESHELRIIAAIHYVTSLAISASIDELMELTIHGGSEEIRDVALDHLSLELGLACADFILFSSMFGHQEGMITPEELYKLALEGETPQLRRAAGEALGKCWERALWVGEREIAWGLELGLELTIADIPRRSTAEAHTLEQALIIFAAENTVAHPELAGAAVKPLVIIWGG